MLAAEDRRVATETDLEILIDGLEHEVPEIQRRAVRAIGRLEQPGLHILIAPMLASPVPAVRAEAASAFAQAALGIARPQGGPPVDVAVFIDALLARVADERDPDVVGVMCEALGRLPYRTAEQVTRVEAAMLAAVARPESSESVAVRFGVAKGLESLIRLQGGLVQLSPETLQFLASLLTVTETPAAAAEDDRLDGFFVDAWVRARRLGLSALMSVGGLERATLELALSDPDSQVRRLAVAALGRPGAAADAGELLARAMTDVEPTVRVAAVVALGSSEVTGACQMLASALTDASPHVSVLAVDRLGACEGEAIGSALAEIVGRLADSDSADPARAWHLPARAFVTLARVSPDDARSQLAEFTGHAVWQVRMYAARAATQLRDSDTLERLASDSHANVREAAIRGLSDVSGHGADAVYRAALEADDYQLVRTAAMALTDTPDRGEAVAALFAALGRLTAQRRDTSRDPRAAIVDRLAQLGSPEDLDRLRPYVTDADSQIAGRAASLLTRWSGEEVRPSPSPRPFPAPPTRTDLDRLAGATATLVMTGGREIAIRLLPEEAPATVARFVRLARDGYYDGLTFHRVVPNFVIQGGSPGANEFMGDGSYLRDELGLRPHVRGAVGISTRGRDTGDAQLFVDLIDNPRLDHNYTVFGLVIAGMDVVDDVREGDVIERVTIAP